MKHGPIALIDEDVPIVVCAPSGPLFEKTAANVQEVTARGGKVILLSDADGLARAGEQAAHTVELPAADPFVAPILYSLPVQLLAYPTQIGRASFRERVGQYVKIPVVAVSLNKK